MNFIVRLFRFDAIGFLFDQFEQLWVSESGLTVMDFGRVSNELQKRLKRHLLDGSDTILVGASLADKKTV